MLLSVYTALSLGWEMTQYPVNSADFCNMYLRLVHSCSYIVFTALLKLFHVKIITFYFTYQAMFQKKLFRYISFALVPALRQCILELWHHILKVIYSITWCYNFSLYYLCTLLYLYLYWL